MSLYQVTAYHFVAGFETNANSVVVRAAPIIYYFKGKGLDTVLSLCYRKQWDCVEIQPRERSEVNPKDQP
jgi:hypothetical protein